MIQFMAMVATDKPDRNGERFPSEVLQNMAMGIPLSLTLNFDPRQTIGRAYITHYSNGALFAKGYARIPGDGILYCVPGGIAQEIHIDRPTGLKILSKFKITEFALVADPADSNLTPIEITREAGAIPAKEQQDV